MAKSTSTKVNSESEEVANFLDYLEVTGAREHNLKELSVKIPRNQLVVLTGISGSGKSSLAFDTIYAEGQRRYMESFSAYARQFIGDLERPDVEQITGLSPVISIEQKTTGRNPRSTVGTVTEIYDFLRLLFARAGDAYSYETGKKMVRFTEQQILEHLLDKFKDERIVLLAPLVKGRKGHYRELFEQIRKQGYLKVRIDGEMEEIRPKMQVDRFKIHDIEVVVDRLKVADEEKSRLSNSLETTLRMGKGLVMVMDYDTEEVFTFSERLMDADTGISYDEPSPNTFSFNSPYGACPTCKGLGTIHEINQDSLIANEDKSISEGGIAPLGEFRDNLIFKQLRSLGKQYDFTLGTKVKDLPKHVLNLILYGNTDHKVDVPLNYNSGERWYSLEYGGVVEMIKRCFDNTSSDGLRRWAESFMDVVPCPDCGGTRLKKEALYFKIADKNIAELANLHIDKLAHWLEYVEPDLSERQQTIAHEVLKELRVRTQFLLEVGLEYLALDRPARTLSGGESQRIRLATQIGSKLSGITYILDEPSIGLHQRDNRRLIQALRELRDAENTVLVVEHDREIMESADYLIDLGPGAGEHGGEVVAHGTPEEVAETNSLTAHYLKGDKDIPVPK